MSVWWWIPIGLAAWFAVAVAVALLLGPVLRRSSRARETLDQKTAKTMALSRKPARDRRQASLGTWLLSLYPGVARVARVASRRISSTAGWPARAARVS